MKKSIRTKMLACFGGLLLLVIVSQMVFNLFLARPYFLHEKMEVVEDSFYELRDRYADDLRELDSVAMYLQTTHSVQITLLKGDEMIYSNGRFDRNDRIPPPAHGEPEDGTFLPETLTFSETPQTVISDENREGLATIQLTGAFTYNGEEIHVIMLLPVASIDNSVGMFTRVSSVILLAAFCIGIVLAVLLSRSITAPIRSVERVAQNLCELDFSEAADESVNVRELAGLAGSINKMSGRLQSTIAELRRANAALQKDIDYRKQLEALRRQFIANVSHEMKTPLALLQIYSENLKTNVENIDKDYYCDVILEETNNLNEMVGRMLDISSIESGLSKMDFAPLDFSALCAQTAAKFAPMLEAYTVETTIAPQLFVNGDAKYLEQAMKNYLANACNHTPAGGKITIALTAEAGGARFAVFNEGKPIAAADLENIWDAFYKSDKARTRTQGNNVGLGLYIVKTVVESHGGTRDVINREDGVEFSFTLPLLP